MTQPIPANVETIYQDIKQLIEAAKGQVVSQVNQTLVLTYWQIGKRIKTEALQDERAQYGSGIIKQLAAQLTREYGSGNDYYIDLLFYHRKLRRLVMIELKLGEFKAEYKGQVELYLKWLAKYEQQADENPPIAIILCSDKDHEVVELLDLEQDNIHVAEYWLQLPPKAVLQAKLHKAMIEAKARLEYRSAHQLNEDESP